MIIIQNVNIVSMKSKKVDDNQSLLIRNDIIEAIGDQLPVPEAACTVIDAQGQYLVPGLINMHTHLVTIWMT